MNIEEKLIKEIVEFTLTNSSQPRAIIIHKKSFKALKNIRGSGSHKQKGKYYYMGTVLIRTKDIPEWGLVII